MKTFDLKTNIMIGLVCVVLGIVFALQYKAVNDSYLEGLFPSQRALQLEAELGKVLEEKETLQNQLLEFEQELRSIQESESKENAVLKNLNEEILKYRLFGGFEDVQGQGLQITVDDPPKEMGFASGDGSVIMYNYDLLLSVINGLNAAGAEAISINGQRIIATTEIHLAGNNLNINNVPTAPPFVIKAIGNADTLEASLNIRFGIVWEMRENYKLQVNLKKFDTLYIEKYKDVVKFRYAKPVE